MQRRKPGSREASAGAFVLRGCAATFFFVLFAGQFYLMFGMYQEYVKIGENAPEVLPPSPPTRDNIELRQPQFIRSFSHKKSWPSDHMPQKAHVAHTYDHGHAALDRPI